MLPTRRDSKTQQTASHSGGTSKSSPFSSQYMSTKYLPSPQSRQLSRNKHCAPSPQYLERPPYLRRHCCNLSELPLSDTDIHFTCNHSQLPARSFTCDTVWSPFHEPPALVSIIYTTKSATNLISAASTSHTPWPSARASFASRDRTFLAAIP